MFQRPEDRMTAVAAAERQKSKAIAEHRRQSQATSRYSRQRILSSNGATDRGYLLMSSFALYGTVHVRRNDVALVEEHLCA